MAEMGELKSYQENTTSVGDVSISELSSEHIFSRQFLEISSEKLRSLRQKKSGTILGKRTADSTNTQIVGRSHFEIKMESTDKSRLFICRLAKSPVGRFMLPI